MKLDKKIKFKLKA